MSGALPKCRATFVNGRPAGMAPTPPRPNATRAGQTRGPCASSAAAAGTPMPRRSDAPRGRSTRPARETVRSDSARPPTSRLSRASGDRGVQGHGARALFLDELSHQVPRALGHVHGIVEINGDPVGAVEAFDFLGDLSVRRADAEKVLGRRR